MRACTVPTQSTRTYERTQAVHTRMRRAVRVSVRLFESISLRISTSSPICCGSSASRLSVRMSHWSVTGSGTSTERSAQLLNESMRSRGSCEIAGGTCAAARSRFGFGSGFGFG